MLALSIQTLLLMGAAYFLGAALACVIRRSLFTASHAPAERRVDPLPEVATRNAGAARFRQGTEPSGVPQPARQPVAQPPPEHASQDLKRIRLIDAGVEVSLNKLGVTRYEQIAGWRLADVQRAGEALGDKARINQENWIEQAQVLANGGETNYSARRARGEAANATPTPDEGERGPPPPSSAAPLPRPMSRAGVTASVVTAPPPAPEARPAPPPAAAPASPSAAVETKLVPPPATASVSPPPLVAERAAFAARPVPSPDRSAEVEAAHGQAAPVLPVRPTEPSSRDNLQRIGGITSEIEQGLNAQGVSRYSQIAHWSPAEVERFDKLLGTGGRIARENWVEQAQILSRGGDTRFSREFDHPTPAHPAKLADAIREHEAAQAAGQVEAPTRTDLGSLRSVRSQAYQDTAEPGPEAARRAATRSKVVRSSGSDDLKRIRGIGVLTEKKLNSMGVITYEHIANWTAADIDRVSQSLDFKGRIERENWVEQARILSAGGNTEFSRRVDRGEVETSRAKT